MYESYIILAKATADIQGTHIKVLIGYKSHFHH